MIFKKRLNGIEGEEELDERFTISHREFEMCRKIWKQHGFVMGMGVSGIIWCVALLVTAYFAGR